MLTAAERAMLCEWHARCIATFATWPPSEARDQTIRVLTERLESIQSNVVPLFRGSVES
jgi:hypothetical protein